MWILLSFVFSGMGALIIGYNQWAKLDGRVMTVWRLGGVLLVSACTKPFLPWPVDVSYYVMAAILGVLLAYADVILADSSRKHGARLAALYVPTKMVVGFLFWVVVSPASLAPLLVDWWRMLVLAFGFFLCFWGVEHIRRNDLSLAGFLAVLPVALIFAAADGVEKSIMGGGGTMLETLGAAVGFLTTTCTVAAVFSAGWLQVERVSLPCDRRTVVFGVGFGVLLMVGISILLLALVLAPNPGYVGAVTMLSSVWLALFARWREGEKNSLGAIFLLVLGAALVAVAGAY